MLTGGFPSGFMISIPCDPEVADHETSHLPRGRRVLPIWESAGKEKTHEVPAANNGSAKQTNKSPSCDKCFTDAPF
jgi:hypothetical protein